MSAGIRPEVSRCRARHANPSAARLRLPRAAHRLLAAGVLLVLFWPQVQLVGTLVFVGVFVTALWVAGSLGLG